MRVPVSTLLLLGLVAAASCHVGRQEFMPPNRCLPGESCFPSRLQLRLFAETLDGKLVFPSSPDYAALVRNVNNRNTRHPAMVVVAETVADVQKAMVFARKHQLMVTAKSDNKDPSGRDNYDGSININLSKLKAVAAVNNGAKTTRSEFGEVTAEAGAVWEDVYTAARALSKDVVAPNSLKSSVGSTVGDGGIGPLVRIYGLVSDNLLEAKVVMADGSLVTVSEYKILQDFGEGLVKRSYDRALLASIAAGGVGPWGVVVAYTFKMKDAPAGIVRYRLVYNLWKDDAYVGEDVLLKVTEALGALPDKWGGYIYVSGLPHETQANTKGQLIVNMMYYGTADAQNAEYKYFEDNILSIEPTLREGQAQAQNERGVLEFEQAQANILNFPEGRFYGFNTLLQSREPTQAKQAKQLTEGLLFALNSPTIESKYFCNGQIMGGAAQDGPAPPALDLVNPKLRSAYMSLSCQLAYPGRGLDDTFYVDHVMDYVQLLSPLGEGKDHFWAQADVPDWKQQFHGHNYGKLIETKLYYDVDNYLWCPNCVGSDYMISQTCNQPKVDKSLLFEYGNMLGGYVSGKRFRDTKQREAMAAHKARLVYIHQMGMH